MASDWLLPYSGRVILGSMQVPIPTDDRSVVGKPYKSVKLVMGFIAFCSSSASAS